METTVLVLCGAGLLVFLCAFFKYPQFAVAGLVITKPLIDFTWQLTVIDDINFLKIYSGLFVLIGAIYVVRTHLKTADRTLSIFWLIFILFSCVGILVVNETYSTIGKAGLLLRILNGFVAFLVFAHVFTFKRDNKRVLSIFLLAGAVPLLFWLVPLVAGNQTFSNDELGRIIGPYRRFWQFNFYGMQTVLCGVVFLALSNTAKNPSTRPMLKRLASFFRIQKHKHFSVTNVVVLLMIIVGSFMVYTCYSKAGWIALFVCMLLWFLLRRKWISSVVVILMACAVILIQPFAADFQKTFLNEIDYYVHGSAEEEIVFRGRLQRWKSGMRSFGDMPLVNKLFGARKVISNPENYYVKTLWDTGIAGLIALIALLGVAVFKVLSRYVRSGDPVFLIGFLALVFFMLYSMGSYPMFSPAFQWFTWGMVGFIFSSHNSIRVNR